MGHLASQLPPVATGGHVPGATGCRWKSAGGVSLLRKTRPPKGRFGLGPLFLDGESHLKDGSHLGEHQVVR